MVGLGLRELNNTELIELCSNSTLPNKPPLNFKSNFSADFGIRVFTSGCYYIDKTSGVWSSYGINVLPDTNYTHTHCKSKHLTDFAGGFLVIPNEINFNSVWANSSFEQNKTIYLTVIIITCLYILTAIWCRIMDIRDSYKSRIHLLEDNKKKDTYLYEIIVYTGSRKDAATDSKIYFIINGDLCDSNKRRLNASTKTPLFRRSAVDSFVMSVNR